MMRAARTSEPRMKPGRAAAPSPSTILSTAARAPGNGASSAGETSSNDSVAAKSTGISGIARKRRMVAMFCKILGEQLDSGQRAPADSSPLSPRQRQTLDLLLAGRSEKEIAAKLSISRHTVHAYVKMLYKRFDVSSRAELLARWVKMP